MIELTQEELKQHFSEPIFGQISETADALGLECYVYIRFLPHIPSYFVFFLSFISRSFWLKTVSHIQCPINGTQNPPEISGG